MAQDFAISLRGVTADDLPVFYAQMHDPAATRMAAHAPRDGDAFYRHWQSIMAEPRNRLCTILADGEVAGHVASWPTPEQRLVGYWVGRRWWGRGVATAALAQFVALLAERPLYAHVAQANRGSIRVLEKCGFRLDPAATAALDSPADGVAESVYALA